MAADKWVVLFAFSLNLFEFLGRSVSSIVRHQTLQI